MFVTVFAFLLLPVWSFVLGVLGFWVGRCARKLPLIDDGLPWTLSRGQIPAPPPAALPAMSADEFSGAAISRIFEAARSTGLTKPAAQASAPSLESQPDTQAA